MRDSSPRPSYQKLNDGSRYRSTNISINSPYGKAGVPITTMSPYSSLSKFQSPKTGGSSRNEELLYTPRSRDRTRKIEPRGSTLAAIANTCNAILGAGAVMMPYGIMNAGSVLGVALTVVIAALSLQSLRMMTPALLKTRPKRYEDMVEILLGSKWRAFFSVTLVFNLFGICLVYLQIIVQQFTSLWPGFVGGEIGAMLAALVIIIPLCMLRDLNFLGMTSSFAIVAIFYITGDIGARALGCMFTTEASHKCPNHNAVIGFNWDIKGIFMALPIFVGSYQCHFSLPSIFNAMGASHTTAARVNMVTSVSYLLCTCLYIPIGLFGYLMFGPDTNQDIIAKNFGTCQDLRDNAQKCHILSNSDACHANVSCKWVVAPDAYVAQAFLAIVCIVSFPLVHFAIRLSLSSILFPHKDVMKPEHAVKYYTMTIVFIVATAALAYAMLGMQNGMGVAINYSVALCSVWQVFIIPSMMWNKIHRGKTGMQMIGWTVMTIGIILSCIELVNTTLEVAGIPLP